MPNDVIAPRWIPSDQSPNYVRYLRGGTAPNRWFVMEWNQQRSDYDQDDVFTFQATLYENGDIDFQYQAMSISGSRWCESSSIEDSTGIDGLSITQFCYPVPGSQAVRITRPAPSARVRIFPQHYGAFFYPGETSLTQIPIRNTGELGTDTYDITLVSPWLALLVHEDGETALTDTDGATLTPATIFQTSQATSPYIFSSYTGYGNTTYSWTPPAGVDSALSATPAIGYAAPGGMATPVEVGLQGRGGVAATSVRLTATLDPRLSYVDDTSGATPTVSGQTVTWNLPDLRLYDVRQFQINLAATGGSLGDVPPVQLQLTSAETDLTPANNQATVQVRLIRLLYLPLLIRQ